MDDYTNKIYNEINNYKNIEVVHDLPDSFHYITNRYIKNLILEKFNIGSFDEMVIKHINALKSEKNKIEILSLGSGNGDFEIKTALQAPNCFFTCYELNPYMINRAYQSAKDYNVEDAFNFVEVDINKVKIDKCFDMVIANQSLHHFVALEHIFKEISKCMTTDSIFLVNDMIGRNGHLFWDSTLDICNRIWAILPKSLKYNHQLKKVFDKRIQIDYSAGSFEGVRAQDILPLLDRVFNFKEFGVFFCLVNRFIDRDFGHNFDINNEMHKAILDAIWHIDDFCLKNKILKPVQMFASLVKKEVSVNDLKFTYFKEPREIYEMKDSSLYDYFNK
ncbi:MAG: class I SAM-dependent methyltransferase [Bacillota bacterium]